MEYLQLMPAAWRLRFPRNTEKEFVQHYYANTLSTIKISLGIGILLYAVFGLLDIYSAPITISRALFYRFTIGVPAILVAFVFAFIKPWRAYLQLVMGAMCTVAGLTLVLIIHQSDPAELAYNQYYVGLIIIMMFTGSWVRLRCWYGLAVNSTLVLGYVLMVVHDRDIVQDRLLFINNNVFLLSALFVASLTCYIFEVNSRIDFLQRKTIEAEKNKSYAQRAELEKQAQELAQAMGSLKAAQVQLIQREKMASLGELTAGIAHEIQNPLNFVTNFAEVNRELVTELTEELKLTQRELAPSERRSIELLLENLTQNQHKIYQHGQRADSIVKSMLEHSRNSTGQRQLTDLNSLVEESLNLSYHGLRAKDHRFHVTLTTDFDPALGMVELVPQDISRVLLNLFANAFYAVRQQAHALGPGSYQPTVAVSTRRRGTQAELRVCDNGTGMSEEVRQKIFQPFFTTKPSGEGTGLGLSLSYDIITKGHGGTLTVRSRPGEGAEFIIELPAPLAG